MRISVASSAEIYRLGDIKVIEEGYEHNIVPRSLAFTSTSRSASLFCNASSTICIGIVVASLYHGFQPRPSTYKFRLLIFGNTSDDLEIQLIFIVWDSHSPLSKNNSDEILNKTKRERKERTKGGILAEKSYYERASQGDFIIFNYDIII